MKVLHEGTATATRGPADWFDGEVWIQALLTPADSPTLRSARVSFASGARTVWHVHPRGQMLQVLSGVCHFQREGETAQTAASGATIWFAPNEKHWHGSAPGYPMVHLAVQEADEQGEVVTWLERVEGE